MLDPKEFVRHARRIGTYVGDFEATSLNTLTGKVTGFAVKAGDEFAWYPTDGPNAMSYVKLMRIFQPLMEDPDVVWRGHHLKYDIQWPILSGVDVQNRLFCTMVASWMLNEDRRPMKVPGGKKPSKYGLKKLIFEHFGHSMNSFDEADSLFGPDLGEYAMDDVRQTDRLADLYTEGLEDDKLTDVYWKIEAPLIPILADMEITGMRLDLKRLRAHRSFLLWSQEHVRALLFKELGYRFDPNSPQQVARVLYDELRLPTDEEERPVAMGKSGQYSTSKETLKLFAHDFPIVRIMLEDRHISVLLNTFCKKLNRLGVRSHDGRIRCSWKQTGTRIGRLASAEPNFQNFPRPDDFSNPAKSVIRRAWPTHLWKPEWDLSSNTIRGCFVADPGNLLIDADLSQIELRMMAHWSEDPTMLEVYRSHGVCKAGPGGGLCPAAQDQKDGKRKDKCRHVDFHTSTAEDIKAPRSPIAKNVNFGACYRIGPRRLKSYAEVPTVAQARIFLQAWYDSRPGVVHFHEWTENYLKKNAWQIRTITGRLRRLLKEMKENDYKAITQGIQFVISGSSQDLLKIGMRNMAARKRELAKEDPRWGKLHFVAQVHDQVTQEGPEEIADDALKLMIECMEQADGGALSVPVVAEGGTGMSWADAH